jgi:RimJ/RimL family protein N-acetyltransferase
LAIEIIASDLLLRPPQPSDLEAVIAACRDPEIPRFIPLVAVPYEEGDAMAWLAAVERAWQESDERTFVITDRARGTLLGAVTVRLEGGSVGYWLAPDARGRGVMTKAVKAVVDWARTEHGIKRLFLTTHPDNLSSQRVAERAGFVRVGSTDHQPPFRDGTTSAVLFKLQ